MSKRRIMTYAAYARDGILFVLGVVLILKQAGIGLAPPEGGPNIELLSVGALFCNGPLFLRWYALRIGTSGSSGAEEQQPLASRSQSSSTTGGDT